jgi:hypothetical protein
MKNRILSEAEEEEIKIDTNIALDKMKFIIRHLIDDGYIHETSNVAKKLTHVINHLITNDINYIIHPLLYEPDNSVVSLFIHDILLEHHYLEDEIIYITRLYNIVIGIRQLDIANTDINELVDAFNQYLSLMIQRIDDFPDLQSTLSYMLIDNPYTRKYSRF